jgi:mgtE-like transporter
VFFAFTIIVILTGFMGWLLIGTVFSIILFITAYLILKNFKNRFFKQTLREGSAGVILASIMGGFNGVFLSVIQPTLSQNGGLVALYPALTNALGNIGSIIGATSTTNMALGYTRNFFDELKSSLSSIVQIEISAATMHVIFAFLSFSLVGGKSIGASLVQLVIIALSTNFSSFIVISLFALAVANITFKKGLNPDNLVIPAITSISDSVATLSIIPAIWIAMSVS